jgi:transposase
MAYRFKRYGERCKRDHRMVLGGVLWVMRTGASWRDLPDEEFGPWQTIYGRYRKWCEECLWQRIVEEIRTALLIWY